MQPHRQVMWGANHRHNSGPVRIPRCGGDAEELLPQVTMMRSEVVTKDVRGPALTGPLRTHPKGFQGDAERGLIRWK